MTVLAVMAAASVVAGCGLVTVCLVARADAQAFDAAAREWAKHRNPAAIDEFEDAPHLRAWEAEIDGWQVDP